MTSYEELVECMAEAMCEATNPEDSAGGRWDRISDMRRDFWLKAAVAGIEAMGGPCDHPDPVDAAGTSDDVTVALDTPDLPQDTPAPSGGPQTVAEAREWVSTEAEGDGVTCPVCDQFAKVYRRNIYATVARQLIAAWINPHKTEDGWFHLGQATGYKGGDIAKVKYWGLLEEAVDVAREDGGKAGVWRFTDLGAAWVQGRTTVPKYAYIYNGYLRRLDGPPTTIQQALGNRFNLRDLMGPAPLPPEDKQ